MLKAKNREMISESSITDYCSNAVSSKSSCRIHQACKEETDHITTLLVLCVVGCVLTYEYFEFKPKLKNQTLKLED